MGCKTILPGKVNSLTASFITVFPTSFLILTKFPFLKLTAFVSVEGFFLSSSMGPAGMLSVQCNHWYRVITALRATSDMQRERKGLRCLLQASLLAL